MNLKSFSKFAVVSAIALTAAMHATGVIAAPYNIGDPLPVPFEAVVVNVMDVTVVDGSFGEIGAIRDTADVALLTMAPDGTITDDPGDGFGSADPAALVANPGGPAPVGAEITVANAFANVTLFVTFDNCQDLVLGAENLILDDITTDLATTAAHDCSLAPGAFVASEDVTDGAGGLVFNIGASLTTPIGAYAAYTDGTYAGSVDMYITY